MSSKVMVSTETMTGRERILATFKGEEVDRLPVWLKMANPTWKSAQPEPYKNMDNLELLRKAGCDLVDDCGFTALQSENPHITTIVKDEGNLQTTITQTPDGELVSKSCFAENYDSTHPVKYPVSTVEDLKKIRWLYRDNKYVLTEDKVLEARARQENLVKQDVITTSAIGPSPLMAMFEYICGPANAVFLLYDEPELFAEVIQLMHQDNLKKLACILSGLAADTFWMCENTSTTLISPALFAQFCLPHLKTYGKLILEHGIIPVHHMCGKLGALLEMIDKLPALVNEAFTTSPVGDTSLCAGRERMPTKVLMGGTNATLWLQPEEKIIAEVAADLESCPDRRKIFLTSAGVLPPVVSFIKAEKVIKAFKEF